MPAGYSQRSLVEKLGIKPGSRLTILGAPPGYDETLGALPEGVVRLERIGAEDRFDWIQLFAASRPLLARRLPALRGALVDNGALWVSWPKKKSGVKTDLTEDVVRALAIAAGLVDVKVCAIDDVWSGLKLVVPLRDRASGR